MLARISVTSNNAVNKPQSLFCFNDTRVTPSNPAVIAEDCFGRNENAEFIPSDFDEDGFEEMLLETDADTAYLLIYEQIHPINDFLFLNIMPKDN